MPKAPSAETVRERAHKRALATVKTVIEAPIPERQVMAFESNSALESSVVAGDASAQTRPFIPENWINQKQEETPLPETEQVELEAATDNHQNEVVQQKPMGRPRKEKESSHRGVDEDFFDYLARIDPKDWSSVQTSGLYIYKLQSGGNLRIGPVLRKAITFDELKDIAIKHGPGNYKVQFQTRLTHLTKCGEVVPFDADSLPENASQRMSGSQTEMKGFDKAIEASSNMLEHSAKTAIDLHKEVQVQNNKAPDTAGLITAIGTLIAAMQPKPIPPPPPVEDKMTPLLVQMLQNQVEVARADADRREQRAREDAAAQRERDNQFFQLMLKQSDAKADSLNQMTGLLTSFMKVKETIDDTMGGGPKGPWDLVGQVADGVLQQGPAIVAALKGAPPQQVAQMQNPQMQPPPEAQPFYDMVIRLAKYFQRDPANYNGQYLVDMIEAEYGAVFSEIINQPKDEVLKAVAAFEPYGKAIMEHPQASVFMAKIIDAIKFPDTMDDIFPDEPEEKEPIILHGKARKVNGKAKSA